MNKIVKNKISFTAKHFPLQNAANTIKSRVRAKIPDVMWISLSRPFVSMCESFFCTTQGEICFKILRFTSETGRYEKLEKKRNFCQHLAFGDVINLFDSSSTMLFTFSSTIPCDMFITACPYKLWGHLEAFESFRKP